MKEKGSSFPRLALYTFLSGWIGFVIYAALSYESPDVFSFAHHFLSPEHGGIRYRAFVLFAPLLSTILGFLIYEREKLLRKALSSSVKVEALDADLQNANENLQRIVDELRISEERIRRSRQNLQIILDSMPFGVVVIGRDMKVRHANKAALEKVGYGSEEELVGKRCKDTFCVDDCDCPIIDHGVELDRSERVVVSKDGRRIPVMKSALPITLDGEGVILEAFVDITERKEAERALRESERSYRSLAHNLTGIPYRVYIGDSCRMHCFNDMLVEITGYTEEELSGGEICGIDSIIHEEDRQYYLDTIRQAINSEAPYEVGYRVKRKDGEVRHFYERGRPVFSEKDIPVHLDGIIHDVTERWLAEEALRQSEASLANAQRIAHLGNWRWNISKNELRWSDEIYRIFGLKPQEFGANYEAFIKTVHPEDREFVTKSVDEALQKRKPYSIDHRIVLPDGTLRVVHEEAEVVYGEDGKPTQMDGTVHDITERKEAEEKVHLQLEHLRALRTIDLAITGSLDLEVVINVFLDQTINQLKADAAGILLFNKNLLSLEQGFGRGFSTGAYKDLSIALGEGLAGRVAIERKALLLPDIAGSDVGSGGVQGLLMAEEGFRSYFGVPLVVKGQVKGVLEIYHRTNMTPGAEWLDFLDALAGQAAIAVDNATLFDDLQRSRDELVMAYDTTIEGWAKALDYRDKETEGHSRRVTDLTVEIASKMGIGGEDILHVRRGALLHDIGKLGVPDAVLFKPGKLTDEEWVQMKRHPEIAHELLYPIRYLRPAVDIPYCHHEKWDGSGYPRGLKGEQIPLAARIFAVVDVWDALRSDRPYRKAWPVDKTLDLIRSEAGKHFDPEVVEVFLNEKDWSSEQ